jgi:hypothetical protein
VLEQIRKIFRQMDGRQPDEFEKVHDDFPVPSGGRPCDR